jgi:hypothetical protein
MMPSTRRRKSLNTSAMELDMVMIFQPLLQQADLGRVADTVGAF